MKIVKPGDEHQVPRGILGGAEVSQATTGAHNIYMARFRVPAGRGRARITTRAARARSTC